MTLNSLLVVRSSMAITSFDFEFEGLSREGRCGLTIEIPPDGSPPSVVCSQKHEYPGSNITIEVERIARKFYTDVALRHLALLDSQLSQVETELRDYWKRVSMPPSLNSLYGHPGARWIEHYPAGTGSVFSDSFREIWFDGSNSPLWRPAYNLASARQRFGTDLIQAAYDFGGGNLLHDCVSDY